MVVKFDGNAVTQRNRGLVSKGYGTTGSQFWWRIEAGDWSRFYMVDENGTAKTLAGNLGNGITTNVYDGQWHHLAIVRDTENHRIKFYLDKILVMDQTDPLAGGIFNNSLLYLGTLAGGTDLLGSFDTIRISDEALTATQFIPEPATVLLLLGGGMIVSRFKH
ncbi:MAG: hypothetical protein BWY67_01891 [Bacteroidetes bacterium ADurb.Bin397]|nr:MAG: hypothetical protein BWY67_01891 [Bacteroidetes bacterium ADurb.Bin397]